MGTINDNGVQPEKMGTVSSDAAQVNIGVTKYLRVSPSCKREFKLFCKSKNSSVSQVPYYNVTRWLSAGGTVCRVFRIRLIIHEFLDMREERGRELAKNFEDPVFRTRLAFRSD